MAKKHSNSGIGPDNWLYIASHALSLFREEGGTLVIRPNEGGLLIELPGILPGDSRIHENLRDSAEEGYYSSCSNCQNMIKEEAV